MKTAGISILSVFAILLFVDNTQAQHQPQAAVKHYATGIELYEEGFFEESIRHLNQFRSQYPGHELRQSADYFLARAQAAADSSSIESYYQHFVLQYPGSELATVLLKELGHRFTDNAQYTKAIEYYEQASSSWMKETDRIQTTYWIAEAAAQNGDYELARAYYLQLADDNKSSEWAPRALYARGRLYLEEENFDAAADAFELLKERYPNNPVTRRVGTALGESYYIQGRYEEAVDALEAALPHLSRESRIKAVFLIAESFNYLNEFDAASRAYLQFINLTKDTPQERIAHYGLGWVYHKQEIYHWAAEAFGRAAVGNDETARKAQYYKAVNEKLGGQYGKSIESFREFGRRYQSGLWVEEAYYEWAISSFEAGFYGEAIETLLTLIRNQDTIKNPGNIFTMLGEAYYANAEYTRAIQAFEEAEKIANIPPELKRQATFQKAWILFQNQAYLQAQPLFEEVYREAPSGKLGGEALFWSADSYYRLGQYNQAAQRFTIFLENYRDSELVGAARYSLGWSYFLMGQYDKAVGPLEKFLEEYNPPPIALFPYDVDTKLRVGDSYYALGDYRKAIESYNKAIGAEPGGDYAMFQVANSYYRAGRTFDAVSYFRRMLRIYPFSRMREQAQYNIAYIYLNTNNYAQAIEEFHTVINRYPGTDWAARSQYNIGDAYYNAGEYNLAVQAYQKVLDNYPRSNYIIEAINGIQYAQLSGGGQDSSAVILEEFLSSNPSSSTADQLRYRQAYNIFQTGDYENAIKEFRQYLRITNSDRLKPETYSNLGEAYRRLGQINEAMNVYETLVNEFPNHELAASALITMGMLYFAQDEFEQSHRKFNQLLEIAPRYRQDAYVGMGNASMAQNKTEAARNEYEQALRINSANEGALVGMGKVAIAEGNYEQAQNYLKPIAENSTTEIGAEAQFHIAQMLQKQQLWEAAIEAYSKVRVLFSSFDNWVANAMYNSAVCHIQTGNRAEALSLLNAVVENYQGTEAAARAATLLKNAGL